MFGQGRIDNDMASNKRRRHTPNQIIRKLAEGNKRPARNWARCAGEASS
jgi:hypothetical protein